MNSYVNPTGILDLVKLLTQGTSYLSANLGTVSWSIATQLAASSFLAIILSDVRTQPSSAVIHQGNAWQTFGERAKWKEQKVKVSVRLKGGRDVVGYYVGASTDREPAKRELIIGAPLTARMEDSSKTVKLDLAWQRLAISGAEIESVTFAYEAEHRPVHRATQSGT